MKWYYSFSLLICSILLAPFAFAAELEVPLVLLPKYDEEVSILVVYNPGDSSVTYELEVEQIFSWTSSGAHVLEEEWFVLPHEMVVVSPKSSVDVPYEIKKVEKGASIFLAVIELKGVREKGIRPKQRRTLVVVVEPIDGHKLDAVPVSVREFSDMFIFLQDSFFFLKRYW